MRQWDKVRCTDSRRHVSYDYQFSQNTWENSLRRFIDEKWEQIVLRLFEKPQKRALNNVHTSIYKVMEQVAVKAFFTGGADKLFGDKINNLAESQNFRQRLV